jgi:hypothetical protein
MEKVAFVQKKTRKYYPVALSYGIIIRDSLFCKRPYFPCSIWSPLMSVFSKISWLPLVAFMLVLTGCGGEPKPDGLPQLYPVSLKFVQEGEPIDGLAVVLMPQSDSKWASGGVTDANGVAVLRTHGKFVGAPAGAYKVRVQKQETSGEVSTTTDSTGLTTYGTPKMYDLVNPDYFHPDKTPFAIEVVDGKGKNNFEPFDLGKKVHILVPRMKY